MSLARVSYMHERSNDAQKEAIRNMGFGGFLYFEVAKIHGKFVA